MSDDFNKALEALARLHGVTVDELQFECLLRIATKEQWDKQVHVAASPEQIDEVLKQGIPAEFLKAAREAPSIADVLSDPNGPASKPLFPPGVGSYAALRDVLGREPPREDVGFALTDTGSAGQAVDTAIRWGGEIRHKLARARGMLDSVADDLEEVGGWEETIKDMRQTLSETADMDYYVPKPRPEGRGHIPIAYELDRVESIAARLRKENRRIKEQLAAAYEAAGISDLQNLAQHIRTLRAERDALLKEKQQVQGT